MRLRKNKKDDYVDIPPPDESGGEEDEGYEEEEEEEETPNPNPKPKRLHRAKPKVPKQRYAMFNIPPRIGMVDTETEEIIAGGENVDEAVLQALANIKAQIERIENMIGSIIEE